MDRCCPTAGFTCGLRFPPIAGSRAPTVGAGKKFESILSICFNFLILKRSSGKILSFIYAL